MITLDPDLHDGIADEIYHRDPAVAPSLSSSTAKLLIERSPLHAWTAHPRLNPNWRPDPPKKNQEIGTAAHSLLLGVGRGLAVVKAPDWRGGEAKKARATARKDGLVPVLEKDADEVRAAVAVAREQLAAHEVGDVLANCRAEVTMIWRDGPIWCRGRIDCLPAGFTGEGRARIVDYKTSDASAEPDAFTSRLYGLDGDVQAALYEDGLRTLYPKLTEIEFLFISQEMKPPYALSVVSLSNPAIGMARERVAEAKAVWRTCMAANRWPGYPPRILRVDAPGWVQHQHEERKQLGATPSALLKVAMDWQRPHQEEAA